MEFFRIGQQARERLEKMEQNLDQRAREQLQAQGLPITPESLQEARTEVLKAQAVLNNQELEGYDRSL
jgi:hypothetical protein